MHRRPAFRDRAAALTAATVVACAGLGWASAPGRGAQFLLNGRSIGSIDEPEFARAFFAIWFDPRTRSRDLRASLLGGGR